VHFTRNRPENWTRTLPELRPFPALRFAESAGDLSLLLAPPYDVIDPDQAAELAARSEHNCVRVILPAGPEDTRYDAAAAILRGWISRGILATDREPSAYVYRQEFEADGKRTERTAVFAALRLTRYAEQVVLPHERTHSGPKKDRLALTLATRTQLSPVFMVARDSGGTFHRLSRQALAQAPAAQATTPDGIRHTLWRLTGDEAASLLSVAGAGPLLIADGHHRYETALATAELLGDNVKAAYLLTCIVSQEDPGLLVRPTHRVLSGPPTGGAGSFDWPAALLGSFELEDLGALPLRGLEDRAASLPTGAFLVAPEGSRVVSLATARPLALSEAGIPDQEARIAPIVFDRLVLGALYGVEADEAAHRGILSYSRTPIAAPKGSGGCSFVLPPVSLDDVWATALRGGRLPPKSTYFEPKIPSGLLFRPL